VVGPWDPRKSWGSNRKEERKKGSKKRRNKQIKRKREME
jgi:hypothetical protein